MKILPRLFLLISLLLPGLPGLQAQYVPVHLKHEGIYRFLDELAAGGHIHLHSLLKPYSRVEVARLLETASENRDALNRRQQAELDFYLRDFGRETGYPSSEGADWLWQKKHGDKRFDVFYYRDSLFSMTVNPVLGTDVWVNGNGSFYHWWNGVEVHSRVGRLGVWASLRDNHESEVLTSRDFQNQRTGAANIKFTSAGNMDYEEFRGGIAYAWDWGHAGLIMDQFSWGESNAGAGIFSGRTPAFPRLELDLEPASWFSFRYVYASLVSEVVDSARSFWVSNSYGDEYREVYHQKYLAANMFTFTPFRGFQLAVGNSVVHDTPGPSLWFLVPAAFYKSVDHTMNARIDNMNSQLFLSLSSRNLRGFHFYGSIFIDELAVDRISDPDEYNFVSYKGGASAHLPFNLRLAAEYTWTNALTYMHYVPTTTYESNRYNLGHFLEDNARDLYLEASWSPWRTLRVKAWLRHSLKGPDHTELGTMPRPNIAPFDPVVWEDRRAGVLASVQLINDLCLRLGWEWRNVEGEQDNLDLWTPAVYHGTTSTLRFGINYGF